MCCVPTNQHFSKEEFEKGREDGRNGLPPQKMTDNYLEGYSVGQKEYVIEQKAKKVRKF